MAQQQRQQRTKIQDVNSRREGSRWIGERPSGEDVASWFVENVKLDEGMNPQDWIGGITLISSTETVLALHNGDFVDLVRLVHVPYARVDARIAYFWALCEQRGWLGEIEPVNVARGSADQLPPGFGSLAIKLPDGKVARFLTCTQKVTVWEYGVAKGDKRLRKNPPPATKQVPMVNRYGYPDDNLMMKAETGAVGRALGMAGVFVLPGSGVATAEDMMEFLAATGSAVQEDVPELPDEAASAGAQSQDTGQRIAELLAELEERQFAEFEAWCSEKNIDPADLRPSQLRSVLRKLESYFVEA